MLKSICSSVLLVLALCAHGYADEHFPFLGVVSKESVNVRAGANTNFEKIDKLKQGDQVVVLSKSYEWYKIQLPSTAKAYVRADYVTIHDSLSAELVGNNVNVRATPSSDAATLGQLKKGTVVKVLEQVNGWCRIEPTAGIYGWVHQDFISVKSEQVPVDMMPKPMAVPVLKVEPNPVETTDVPEIKIQGRLQKAVDMTPNVHYCIMKDGKPLYFIEDMPQLSHFANAQVEIEGKAVSNHSQVPVLHITKIKFVL